MPGRVVTRSIAGTVGRVPGLRRVPVLRLLAAAQVAVLARDHLGRLTPQELRRLVALLRTGRGRPSNLSEDDRNELAGLVAKVEPRLLAGEAVKRLSPVPLPRRLLYGRRR